MIDFNPTALVGSFDFVSAYDDAIAWPAEPGEGASDDEKKAYADAMQQCRDKFRVAHETGDLSKLPLKEGAEPTVIKVRIPAKKDKARARGLARAMQMGEVADRDVRVYELCQLVVESARTGANEVQIMGDEDMLDRLSDTGKGDILYEIATALARKMTPGGNS